MFYQIGLGWLSSLRLFQLSAHQGGAILDQFQVLIAEGSGKVAVNIEFAHDLAADKHRHAGSCSCW